MILLIDHHDSFVETLARYSREAGHETMVVRVDRLDMADVLSLAPDAVILSPGPGRPADTPWTQRLFHALGATPVLGVCLGHQALIEAYGGTTGSAPEPMHGRASLIRHSGDGLFYGVPSPFLAARYHSLIGQPETCSELDAIAWTENEGQVMAVRHQVRPHCGVQFHPESLLTPHGAVILRNFLKLIDTPSFNGNAS